MPKKSKILTPITLLFVILSKIVLCNTAIFIKLFSSWRSIICLNFSDKSDREFNKFLSSVLNLSNLGTLLSQLFSIKARTLWQRLPKLFARKSKEYADLNEIVKNKVISKLDHSLIQDNPWFFNKQPSTENLVVYIWEQIVDRIKSPAKLYCIKLRETGTIFTEYYGDDH